MDYIPDYLAKAKKAVEQSHACLAQHIETVPVHEIFQGKTAWKGDVEVFTVTGNPKAKRAYAWGYSSELRPGKYEFIAVLEVPPVT